MVVTKDLSKKIRTALHTMQKQGKWVGGKIPLGYTKDLKDKNKLIIYEKEKYDFIRWFTFLL